VTPVRPLADLLTASPLPAVNGGKHERGTVSIVAGADTCPGGAVLAGVAALRVGVGRARLVTHPDVAVAVGVAVPEALVVGWQPGGRLPPLLAEQLRTADAVLVGPGLAPGAGVLAVEVAAVVPGEIPLMLDALALDGALRLRDQGRTLVLAPNPTEAARLLDADAIDDREVDIAEAADALARRYGTPAAVRGAVTVVADGQGGCWCERGGVPGLGTAGSGDVFAGAAVGLLGRGADPLAALAWAVAVHAAAGRRLVERIGEVGFLAREVADALPEVLADERGAEGG
jgi:ADP-dependent NAD(P)H-hydrate dehydratase